MHSRPYHSYAKLHVVSSDTGGPRHVRTRKVGEEHSQHGRIDEPRRVQENPDRYQEVCKRSELHDARCGGCKG